MEPKRRIPKIKITTYNLEYECETNLEFAEWVAEKLLEKEQWTDD